MPETLVDLHVRLPKALHDRLVKMATQDRRSLNNLLIVLVDQWLDEHAPQLEREKKRSK